MNRALPLSAALTLLLAAPGWAQTPPRPAGGEPTAARTQVETDAFTRYELLEPGSGKFRIVYEVTDATPGARAYFNPIRKGSVATDERVVDRATGRPLRFEVVSGTTAQATGLPEADAATDYIRVQLSRPVPPIEGEARILIEKTYQDARSYFTDGQEIVFDRPLGIKRNTVVLPAGYELVACNTPSQVLQDSDGRIRISFFNTGAGEAPLRLRARRGPGGSVALAPRPTIEDRAHQSRDIVYELGPPEGHSFSLYHDYTETRAGEHRYVNVVRTGSHAAAPSGVVLDTGEPLRTQIIRGAAIATAGLPPGDLPPNSPEAEVVVFSFPAVAAGGSTRIRMRETYTDPKSYRLEGDTLVLERSFGRPANAVVLPAGWSLTGSSVPATVSTLPDGRVRLDLLNPRLDELNVVITARRRPAAAG